MDERNALSYAVPTRGHAGARWVAISAFVVALSAPLIVGGILFGVSALGFDIDDALSRQAAVLLVTVVGAGIPFVAAAAGAVAAARLVRGPRRTLSMAAVVIGTLWGIATLVFLSIGFAA